MRLTYTINGKRCTVPLKGDRITIGRMPGNTLVLPNHTVSRRHAECVNDNGEWFVMDLDSRNGTLVNEKPVKRERLSPGDMLHVGGVAFNVEEDPKTLVTIDSFSQDDELPITDGTIIRSIESIEKELKPKAVKSEGLKKERDADRYNRLARILEVLSEVAKTLITATDLDELLEKILDVIFQHLPAERAVILLLEEGGEDLVPRAVRQAGKKWDSIQISNSIAGKSFREGVAILSPDAQVDPRFSTGESIQFLGIRSALCVPLKLEDKTLGLIYADTPLKTKAFDEVDLEILSVLSGYAAVGIRQAELHAAVESERRAKTRLERYHSPSVVERILSSGEGGDGTALQVREIEGTVLFADLVGFTSMAENMPPADVAKMLNLCFSRMTDVIFNNKGTLDKFIGDAIMAIFGAPIPYDDHAVNAVRCALEMQDAINTLNIEEPGDFPLIFRIGINSGPLVAGDIGSIKRRDYTVLGSTVNLASRLESEVAQPGRVAVGESTYRLAADHFEFKKIGKVKVKGISKTLSTYEVVGVKGE